MLYLLHNSSLLLPNPPSLNKNNFSLAYIDDVAHLLATNTIQQGQTKVEEVMIRSKRWASRHGAIFDEKKTNIMIFTRKKQPLKELVIAGATYGLRNKIKWLRITLTPTLAPTCHIQIVKAKAKTTLNQLKRIIKPTFGLCQWGARTLVVAVLTTRILQGSIIWYMEKNKKNVEKQLTTILFQAVRLCTGMIKQTPSPFLKLYGGVRDLTKQHIRLTHNYIHSKLTAPVDNVYCTLIWKEITSNPRTHPSPLNNLLGKSALLKQNSTRAKMVSPLPILPWSTQITKIINDGLMKEAEKVKVLEQMKAKLMNHSLVFFTDGSLIPGKGEGAAAMLVALKNTALPKKKSPGHPGIQQNKEVDELVKEAANTGTTSTYTLHHISISKLKQVTKQNSSTPPNLSDTERARIKFKTPPKLIIQPLDQLEKGLAATIHQLCSNHAPLNEYLHRIKQVDSPLCLHCNTLKITPHYILFCKRFQNQRREFKKKITKHRLRLNPNSYTSILDFPTVFPFLASYIISTARFQYIRNYIPPNLTPAHS
ncbi:hypothetical protein O181_034568 [Austropuccinia psidii MF-1]|uniref:Reverse transcriptase domain-containing protein n=1 Tax=Austropuccinia psidii MF-1 TaxID=1389203 RepID=A0A9Q3D3R1_9BASI|nr:hypothetical protein [Austropuccinia psidii MF-1]